MSRSVRIAVFVLLVAGMLALAGYLRFSGEPAYGGKPLSAWLSELGKDTLEERKPAVEAIRQIGSNATPAVIRLLRNEESFVRRNLRELAGKQSFVKLRFEDPWRRRQRAFMACDALGPAAAPVVPALLNLLTNQLPEPDVPYLLARIGPAALPALNSALTNDVKAIRLGARCCLELLRTNAAYLHPENRPIEEQDFLRRTCEYHVMIMRSALKEYVAQRGRNFTETPPSSLPDDFDPKVLEVAAKELAEWQRPTNSPSRFE